MHQAAPDWERLTSARRNACCLCIASCLSPNLDPVRCYFMAMAMVQSMIMALLCACDVLLVPDIFHACSGHSKCQTPGKRGARSYAGGPPSAFPGQKVALCRSSDLHDFSTNPKGGGILGGCRLTWPMRRAMTAVLPPNWQSAMSLDMASLIISSSRA